MPTIEQTERKSKRKEQLSPATQTLMNEITQTKRSLDAARDYFEYATDPELVSSCIFEIKALQLRYSHLLHLLREEMRTSHS